MERDVAGLIDTRRVKESPRRTPAVGAFWIFSSTSLATGFRWRAAGRVGDNWATRSLNVNVLVKKEGGSHIFLVVALKSNHWFALKGGARRMGRKSES
jgi:hypothetical protein